MDPSPQVTGPGSNVATYALSPNSTSIVLRDLPAGSSLAVAVTAYNAVGFGPAASVTSGPQPVPPSVASTLRVDTLSSGRSTLKGPAGPNVAVTYRCARLLALASMGKWFV